jgi:hypothetical protein
MCEEMREFRVQLRTDYQHILDGMFPGWGEVSLAEAKIEFSSIVADL